MYIYGYLKVLLFFSVFPTFKIIYSTLFIMLAVLKCFYCMRIKRVDIEF